MTKQAVFEQAKELSKQDQLELALDLWDLVDGNESSTTITPELAEELDRRFAADDADQSPGQEWSVLRERLLRGEL
jgi:putative addiction module component (TIGR02574 family)